MGLRIKKYKGGYRSHWYAYYSDHNQKQEIRLDERIAGTPPSSLSVKDRGDAAFERSRDRAQAKLDEILASLRQKGASEAIMERLIESKTGIKPTYHRLDQLAALWNGIGRAKELSDGRKAENTFVANEFAAFCKKTYLYEVTEADAERYFRWINGKLAWSTVLSHMSFLSGAFTRFLPAGSHNPFKSIMKRNGTKEAATIYGWHSFRTTFCVQAILHHIPESMIIKAVGHSTFKTTNEYYNNPKRASIKEVWMKALGSTAIGAAQTPLLQDTITIQP